ncbi:hypothetical protein O6H91_23G037800 [Diphasiastrum complanatum]|uniref:Uncharacterized protein n=2 Tax=Diphasiastrum complanatum TaxID=34168 RepID=A0ACC2A9Q9_DIPCM|nr:hypothetical protein O6H91_23G037800 [Diphasiastrum complanatum]
MYYDEMLTCLWPWVVFQEISGLQPPAMGPELLDRLVWPPQSRNCILILFCWLLCMTIRVDAANLVFAHYMLWAPLYTNDVAGFQQEIQLAQKYGIDAFALNTAVWDDEYQTRADNIYQAATGTDFKLFFSADLSGGLTAQNLQTMLTRYAHQDAQLYYQSKQFFSTFIGQDTVFSGYSDPLSSWRDGVLQPAGGNIFFVPFFVTDGSQSSVASVLSKFNSIIDGLFAWDTSAWPYFNGDYNNPSAADDMAYLAACRTAGKLYMASVSPWFFAHEQRENLVKGNYQGAGLWISHWQQLIRLQPPLVEIITWNDWAERSYVVPVGTGWGAPAYNDTPFPHQAFLELGAYYIQWYKSGAQPAIPKDSLFIFYYTHSKNAVASNDNLGAVQNQQVLDDQLHVTVLLTQPATVRLVSGSSSQDFSVDAGVQSVSIPFEEGQQSAVVLRNGANVLSLTGALPITNTITTYDFNVYSNYIST